MPSLIDLRRRIRSVKNTEQITKAMKMVSAAKLRRAQQAVVGARPYAGLLEDMLGSVLATDVEEEAAFSHPLLERRVCRNVQLLVLAGEKGLCGSFNSNVFKAVQGFVDGRPGQQVDLELLGRKAVDFYQRRNLAVSGRWEQVLGRVEVEPAQAVAEKAMERFSTGQADEVWIAYNRFKGVLSQQPVVEQVLPIIPPEGTVDGGGAYEYEQPAEQLLGALLPKRVVTQVFLAMLESASAEHAARMTAMDAATRNAGEVLEKLTLHLNRVRQASITTEIIEIVSGTAAQE
ncbi:MAG: ATP synthase F1 subunit gamma [Bryobacterales bacterium]|nr:ATP synthase F1 subunit gamma [Bryobacterales bacterium]MDE0621593.1 ATP synthase F1 subunit gamma [Bryobacterales bacterium]